MRTIKIAEGNGFDLVVPLTLIGDEIDEGLLAALQVVVRQSNGVTVEASITTDGSNVVVSFADALPLGSYDVEISGTYAGRDIAVLLNNAFAICRWSNGADFASVTPERVTTEPQPLVGWYTTDAELEALKQQYREATAAAEAARQEWERKTAEIEGVAQEATLTQLATDAGAALVGLSDDVGFVQGDVTAIRNEIGDSTDASGDPTVFGRIGDLESEIGSVSGVVVDIQSDMAQETTSQQILSAVEHIDFSELAKQGDNSRATNTAILAGIESIDISAAMAEYKQLIVDAILSQDATAGVTVASSWQDLSDAIENFDVVATDMTQAEIQDVVDELSLNILGV